MSLINCSHCNHKVSSDALICPNCSKPIQVLSDRLCENCNERLPKQKRKCPNCGSDNSINNSKQKTGNMNKSNLTLLSILMLVIGAIIMYVVYPFINPLPETKMENAIDNAKVERINGFYVFVESTPSN